MRVAPLLLIALVSFGAQARSDGPLLHEFIDGNPREDLELQATTPDGKLPAALDTPSGIVPAPAEKKNQPQVAYGGNATPDSADATYRIDRDTTRPDAVSYDDPFVPAITPFKRLYAYDGVDENLELTVADKRLRRIEIGGHPLDSEDQFFGDLFVDVVGGVPVRVPSVGPGARVIAARVEPPTNFELVRDGADNWFIIGDGRKRVRLVLQLSISRSVFGATFADVSWGSLARFVPTPPPAVITSARDVLARLGVSESIRPRDAVTALVSHFRAFAPSDDPPRAQSGPSLYQELALGKKGVCRHRSYAFVITALAAGIPARMVRNEAHAWVEVFDGTLWHRVDLGGAAGRFETDPSARAQRHVVPDDPFAWPPGSQSALDSVEPSPSASPSASSAKPPARRSDPSPSGRGSGDSDPSDDRPRAEIGLELATREVRRGAPVRLKGTVTADGDPCPFARVDVVLHSSSGDNVFVGAVPTDEAGRYDATLTVPLQLDVGDYDVVATTPGAGRCGGSY